MTITRGKFITVEGTEGVGKTTNMAFMQQWLDDQGIPYLTTREPGGTELAEQLRELLLARRDEPVNETAELLMIFAARAQHLAQKILPAIQRGEWVLCDRFTDATYAYQGAGRELGNSRIELLETLVQEEFRPDLTLILDIPVELGMQRARNRSEPDRFEQEKMSFFEKVRQCYLTRAADNPARYRIVDASQSLPQVQQQIASALQAFVAE